MHVHRTFTGMANSIVVRQGNEEKNEYWKTFPPFLWLVRDMLVEMPTEDGNKLSPTEFLNQEVLCNEKSKEAGSTEAVVRKALYSFFPKFECKTLPPPSSSTEVMANVSTSHDKLAPSFNEGVDELIVFLKTSVKPKKVFIEDGCKCDGPTLAVLVQEVADAVKNPHSIPPLENTWNLVVKSRCTAVQEQLLEEYRVTIKARYDKASNGCPLEEFPTADSKKGSSISVMEIHEQLWTETKTKLNKEVGPILSSQVTGECALESMKRQLEKQLVQYQQEEIKPQVQVKVRKVVGGAIFSVVEENQKRSREFCDQLFADLYKPIRERVVVGKDGYTAANLAADIKNLFQEYDAQSIGPEKWHVRAKAESKIEENKEIYESHLEELVKRAQAQREIAETYERLQNEMKTVAEHSRQMDESVRELQEQHQQAEERRREISEAEIKELKEKISLLEQKDKKMRDKEMARRIKLTEEQCKREQAEEKLKDLEEALENNKEEEAKRKAASDQKLQTLKKTLMDKAIEEEKKTAKANLEIKEMESQIALLKQQMQHKEKLESERKAHAEKELEKLKQTLQKKEEEEAEDAAIILKEN